jgi:hypothetical protein
VRCAVGRGHDRLDTPADGVRFDATAETSGARSTSDLETPCSAARSVSAASSESDSSTVTRFVRERVLSVDRWGLFIRISFAKNTNESQQKSTNAPRQSARFT